MIRTIRYDLDYKAYAQSMSIREPQINNVNK